MISDLQQRILDNLSTAVLLFDKALRLCYINPAGEMLFEVSARHLLGQPVAELLQQDETLHQTMRACLRSGHPFTRYEVSCHLLHQHEVTADLTATVIKEAGQEEELLLEIFPLDRLLRISRDEHLLDQQMATRELLRGLAHEVKNPLGGLRGAAQLLEKQLPSEDLREYTQVIIDEADRLQNLVDQILGPNMAPIKQRINVHEVLEHVRSLVNAEIGPAVHIESDYDPSIPELQADRDMLIQAVLNVVRNACQALQGVGKVLLRTRILRKFTIGHVRHRLVIKIEIIDDGPGVPPELIEKIFLPMITGRAEGTGLGLSIAQSLISRHDGLIEYNRQNNQTVFSIILPIDNSE